jgi:hypothetical protein
MGIFLLDTATIWNAYNRVRTHLATHLMGTLGGCRTLIRTLRKSAMGLPVRPAVSTIAALLTVAAANVALAQSSGQPSPKNGTTCPPDIKGEPPTVGGGSSEPLSDKLARSKGVICPPAGVDREMQVAPPSDGRLKVIPPPGSPGGDPNVQPK